MVVTAQVERHQNSVHTVPEAGHKGAPTMQEINTVADAWRNLPLSLAAIEDGFAPDVMIFDTPPMLLTHDLMSFAGHVDCVLLVAGAEMTSVKEIDLCERELAAQTNVMGVVFNKCRHIGDSYGYDTYD